MRVFLLLAVAALVSFSNSGCCCCVPAGRSKAKAPVDAAAPDAIVEAKTDQTEKPVKPGAAAEQSAAASKVVSIASAKASESVAVVASVLKPVNSAPAVAKPSRLIGEENPSIDTKPVKIGHGLPQWASDEPVGHDALSFFLVMYGKPSASKDITGEQTVNQEPMKELTYAKEHVRLWLRLPPGWKSGKVADWAVFRHFDYVTHDTITFEETLSRLQGRQCFEFPPVAEEVARTGASKGTGWERPEFSTKERLDKGSILDLPPVVSVPKGSKQPPATFGADGSYAPGGTGQTSGYIPLQYRGYPAYVHSYYRHDGTFVRGYTRRR